MKHIKLLMLAMIIIISNLENTAAKSIFQNSDSIQTITIKVTGVTCAGDLKTIASNVEKVEGVSTCKTGKMGATSSFEVKYNPKKANIKDIHSAIENTGGCENPNDRPYKVKK
jgi:copper chaperone CopZ